MSRRAAEILVVEDDEDERAALVTVLQSYGYSAVGVGDGRQALGLLAGFPAVPKLILLDLRMPVMDGQELLEILRSYKRLASIPIVVMSGKVPATQMELHPPVRFLRKPLDVEALLATLRTYVGPAHTEG